MACKFTSEAERETESGESYSSSSQELEVHPLLLDVILDNVFETLDIQQLLLCRLVCRTWCRNSTLKNVIRSGSVVNLRTLFLHTSTTMENLPNYFRDEGDSIYSYYNFEDICYQNGFISKFFVVIGPTIKSLKLLLNLSQLNCSQFRELIYDRLPNLEELNIYNLSFKEVYSKPLFINDKGRVALKIHENLRKLQLQETRVPITFFMTDLLESLPNLHEISLKVGICRDWLEQADLWRENSSIATSVTNALRVSDAFKTLKVFRCGKLRRGHIDCLLEMGRSGLQLEVVQLHVPHKDSEDVFTEFLNSQKDCLKELILFEQRSARYRKRQSGIHGGGGGGGIEGFVLKLPDVMSKLELLQLSKHYKSVIVPILPVDFSRQCPKLKRLIFLGQCQSPGEEMISLPTVKGSNVEELVLWSRVHHPNIATVLGSFSNLTRLHVRYPNTEFLLALWEACDKIQDLTFIFEEGSFVDEGMTGLSENCISKWLPLAEMGVWSFSKIPSYENEKVEFDNRGIVKLKDLRTLKITVEHNEDSKRQAICDATPYFSLRWMTQLRYMELFTSDWCHGLKECLFLSEKCKKLLEMELELAVIHFAPVEKHK